MPKIKFKHFGRLFKTYNKTSPEKLTAMLKELGDRFFTTKFFVKSKQDKKKKSLENNKYLEKA